MPRAACGIRVIVLPPCPMMNMALRVSGCATWSFGNSVASNQRVLGMPDVSINVLLAKRDCIHS